jgi:chemotaxis protein MotB
VPPPPPQGGRRRVVKKVAGHGHHGGAWKIAYADFVTAMMAFFLMLWLLNSTSQEQRNAISNYFAPQSASKTTSGSGGVLGGRVLDTEGALTASHSSPRIGLGIPQQNPGSREEEENLGEGEEESNGPVAKHEIENAQDEAMGIVEAHDQLQRDGEAMGTLPRNELKDAKEASLGRSKEDTGREPVEGAGGALGTHGRPGQGLLVEGGAAAAQAAEEARFAAIRTALKARIDADKVLREYRDNIAIERTAEGLRIQLLDDDKREMFPSGSAEVLEHTQRLFAAVAELVKNQPNKIAISGHTDSVPFRGSGGYSNWELSTDRANASRRGLLAAGVPESKVTRVVGKADTEPLEGTAPDAAINRRVSIVLLRDPASVATQGAAQRAAESSKPAAAKADQPRGDEADRPPIAEAVPKVAPPAPPVAERVETAPSVAPDIAPPQVLDTAIDDAWLRLR